jgi:hypothetical protein
LSEILRTWEKAARVYVEKGQRQPHHEKPAVDPGANGGSSSHEKPLLSLGARAIKVTLVVDPQGLAGVVVPNGVPRVTFAVGGRHASSRRLDRFEQGGDRGSLGGRPPPRVPQGSASALDCRAARVQHWANLKTRRDHDREAAP